MLEFVFVGIVAVVVGRVSVPVVDVDLAMVRIVAAVFHPKVVRLVGMVGFVVVGVVMGFMIVVVMGLVIGIMVNRFVDWFVRFMVRLVVYIVDRLVVQVTMNWFVRLVLVFYRVDRVIVQVVVIEPVVRRSPLAVVIAVPVVFVEMRLVFVIKVEVVLVKLGMLRDVMGVQVEWVFVKLGVVWNPPGMKVEGMVRGSLGMVGLIMVAEVRVVFYRMMVWVVVGLVIRIMVGLVIGIMVDMMTMVRRSSFAVMMNGSVMFVKMRLIFMAEVQVVLVKFRMFWNVFGVQVKWMMGQPLGLSGYPRGMQVKGVFGKMLGMVGYIARM